MYENITKYDTKLCKAGHWEFDCKNIGNADSPIQLPFVAYLDTVTAFISDMEPFTVYNYREILNDNNINWDTESMKLADISTLDAICLLALITGAIRAERFCSGALKDFIESGNISTWLHRLKELEEG